MHSNSIFQNIMKELPRYPFERIKERSGIKEQTQGFSRWSHLSTGKVVRLTVFHANQHRQVGVFEAMAKHLIQVVGKDKNADRITYTIDGHCEGISLNPNQLTFIEIYK